MISKDLGGGGGGGVLSFLVPCFTACAGIYSHTRSIYSDVRAHQMCPHITVDLAERFIQCLYILRYSWYPLP